MQATSACRQNAQLHKVCYMTAQALGLQGHPCHVACKIAAPFRCRSLGQAHAASALHRIPSCTCSCVRSTCHFEVHTTETKRAAVPDSQHGPLASSMMDILDLLSLSTRTQTRTEKYAHVRMRSHTSCLMRIAGRYQPIWHRVACHCHCCLQTHTV